MDVTADLMVDALRICLFDRVTKYRDKLFVIDGFPYDLTCVEEWQKKIGSRSK